MGMVRRALSKITGATSTLQTMSTSLEQEASEKTGKRVGLVLSVEGREGRVAPAGTTAGREG